MNETERYKWLLRQGGAIWLLGLETLCFFIEPKLSYYFDENGMNDFHGKCTCNERHCFFLILNHVVEKFS